jgi:hypothetical protein
VARALFCFQGDGCGSNSCKQFPQGLKPTENEARDAGAKAPTPKKTFLFGTTDFPLPAN